MVPSATLLRPASDRSLVEHVRAGSEPAFEVLFARHYPAVLAYCRRFLRSAEEAEDAAQQTFVAAYRELTDRTQPLALRPWLYTVARNRCLTALRVGRARPLDEGDAAGPDHVVAEVTAREDLRALLEDVTELPEDQRSALVLALLADMPHDEIADVLGCSHAKVKALVFQARTSLGAARAARATPCTEIRAQLDTGRGAALRRAVLRRHLNHCPGCAEYRDEHRHARCLLPLAPLFWLRRILGGAFGAGGATAGAGVTLSGPGGVALALVTVAIPVAVATRTPSSPEAGPAWAAPASVRVLASSADHRRAAPTGAPGRLGREDRRASHGRPSAPGGNGRQAGDRGRPATPRGSGRPLPPGQSGTHGRPATPGGSGTGRPSWPGQSGTGRPASPGGSGTGRPASPGGSGTGRPSSPGQSGRPVSPGGPGTGRPSSPGQSGAHGRPASPGQSGTHGRPASPGGSGTGRPSSPGQSVTHGRPASPGESGGQGPSSSPGQPGPAALPANPGTSGQPGTQGSPSAAGLSPSSPGGHR